MRNTLIPLLTTLAIQALVSMAALTMPVLAPEAAEAGGAATLAGLFIGFVYAGAVLSSLISGGLIDRFGPIRTSQLCLLFSAAGLEIAAFGALPAICAGGFVLGLGYGPVTPASSHLLARTTPADRMGFIFSLKQTGVPLGGAMAGFLVPPAAALWGWQGAATMVSASCLIMAALSQPVRKELDDVAAVPSGARKKGPGVTATFRLILAHPPLRDMAFCSFFFGVVQLSVTSYMVIWLTESYRIDYLLAGVILAFAQGAGVAGRLLWGWLADRFVPPRILLGLLGLIMSACMAGFAFTEPDWAMAAVVLIAMAAGATAIGWNGVYLAEVARLSPPGMAGVVTGGTLFFTYSGVVVGPPAVAAVISVTGSFAVAFGAVSVMILAVAAFLTLARPAADKT